MALLLFRKTLCFTVCLLLSACALIPAESTGVPINTRTLPPDQPSPPPVPSPAPTLLLPQTDQVIFTIPNTAPWPGREGDSRPGWLGWGAETFTIAPDGSFWIADTAATPIRLLHFTPTGEFVQQISLEGKVVFPFDLLALPDSLWVLDLSAEQPQVIQLSTAGQLLSSLAIDRGLMSWDGEYVFNGAFNLWLGEHNELLVRGVNGLYMLLDASHKAVAQRLEGLSFYGHTYQTSSYDQATGRIPVTVDANSLEVDSTFFIEGEPFLGFNPDGSFALTGYTLDEAEQMDSLVRYYTASGELIATARQQPQTFYKDFNHHLAFGPNGLIYQLVSNPDHSVQVVRLGFAAELPPKATIPTLTPTPLTPLSASTSASSSAELARNALLSFFDNLNAGNYAQAAAYFGGEAHEYMRPQGPDETDESYWEYVCTFLWCLPVAEISAVEQVSEQEFVFQVVFMNPDGTRFEIGACCGSDPAATPPVWQFAFPVQQSDGAWKVTRWPLFTP